jgi:F-type H+-transporting ATPase subunit delta
MKLDKESRKLSKRLFQASFTNGAIDNSYVSVIAKKIVESKPRNAIGVLKEYQRLVRLEVEQHQALIESATELDESTSGQLVANLKAKYGADLSTEFRVTPELLGGIRIKIGSDVFDSSIRERLSRLEAEVSHA